MGEGSFSNAGRPKQYAFFLPCSSTCVCCLYLLFTCKGFVAAKENAAGIRHQLAAPGDSGFCTRESPLQALQSRHSAPLGPPKEEGKFRGSFTLGSSDQTVHFSLDTSTVGGWRAPTPS